MRKIVQSVYILLCILLQQNCMSQNSIKPIKALTQDSLIKKLKVRTVHIIDEGNVASPLTIITTLIYNKSGKLIEKKEINMNSQTTNKTIYTYNDKKLLTLDSTIESSPNYNSIVSICEYIYDSINRLIKKKIKSGNNAFIEEENYKYNNLGLLDSLIKRDIKLIYKYDSKGLCIKRITKPIGELESEKKYIYDIHGWEVAEISPNLTYKTEYNDKGQKTKMYRYIDKYVFLDKYEYNLNGLLKKSSYNRKENDKWKLNSTTKYSYTFY